MAISEAFLPEFDQEMATTRRVLERIPDDRLDWKAHEKSMTLRQIGSHLANLPTWAVLGLKQDSFDTAPPGEEPAKTPEAESVAQLLSIFDANVTAAREAIEGTGDATYHETWALKSGGETLLSFPKIGVVRSFVLNHIVHHRGQVSVYLRLLDVPVPSIYGPSADESPF